MRLTVLDLRPNFDRPSVRNYYASGPVDSDVQTNSQFRNFGYPERKILKTSKNYFFDIENWVLFKKISLFGKLLPWPRRAGGLKPPGWASLIALNPIRQAPNKKKFFLSKKRIHIFSISQKVEKSYWVLVLYFPFLVSGQPGPRSLEIFSPRNSLRSFV